MKIAVLGAGNVGKALGEALTASGHDILYGVRDPKRSEAKPAASQGRGSSGRTILTLVGPRPSVTWAR